MSGSWGVDALRSEPCGFEVPFSMHDTVCRLPRIPLLGTWVNKSKRKEQVSPRLQYLRPSLLGDLFFFRTYHHNRAGGVLDDTA